MSEEKLRPEDKLDEALKDALLKARGNVKVIIMLSRKLSEQERSALKKLKLSSVEELPLINSILASVPIVNIRKLAEQPFVKRIVLDEQIGYVNR